MVSFATRNWRLIGACAIALGAACSGDDAPPDDGGIEAGLGPGSSTGTSGSGGSSTGVGGGSGNAGRDAPGDAGAAGSQDAGVGGEPVMDGGVGATDAGASADAGPSADGGADSGTLDAGGPPVMEVPPGCAGLTQCCMALPEPDRMNCALLADSAQDMMCEQLKPLFCPPAVGGEGACGTLSDCCAMLQQGPFRIACVTSAMSGVELQCEQVVTVFCPGGPANACSMLSGCCATLSGAERDLCDSIVQQGQRANCETARGLFCP